MNVAQLRAFVAVVEERSFSAAARCLGLSQPGVTQQVQALESALGATLFDRAYRRVDLTDQGRALLPHARGILSQIDAAQIAVENASDDVTGVLTLAASTTPGQYVLPRLIGAFVKKNPEVRVRLSVKGTCEVVATVEAGDADFGMTGAHVRGARATYEELGADHLVMLCHPEDPFAKAERVSLAEVVERPFIMREEGSGTRMVMEEALAGAGIDIGDLDVATELGSSEAIVNAVEGGLGLGVVSRWMAEKALALGTVAEVPVVHFPVERPFFLVLPKRALSRAADSFLDHLRAELTA